MRAVLQRVTRAAVRVDGEVVGSVDRAGLVALLAVNREDGSDQAAAMARKIAGLRILHGELSCAQAGAPVLLISQFTLYGDTRKGRRPSWSAAAPGEQAEPVVAAVARELRAQGIEVATGVFGADMQVELVNDGPFTVIVEI
ncbi:D-tyrosyl-tRNA(Tyr) deacylase [Austwickia chelonae]|uniref:D-aminoacyl-tRNA deacylase n=1 Tax=Austwickia chelonae NBRC 105200 TaxID=1184607 RepID=K6V6E9_9MICO|nr:D-aminoacyl-tRNA deacylase [Austwickia chelonae]GAB77818.1 D-tyrosyl-tRNA(Tyr) deacylase [Austwickia chelonae NBRC 105200]SEV90112.1 D-tyrosyl-tRNA(Tyr) deacylase [Austwickia chelonae]